MYTGQNRMTNSICMQCIKVNTKALSLSFYSREEKQNIYACTKDENKIKANKSDVKKKSYKRE